MPLSNLCAPNSVMFRKLLHTIAHRNYRGMTTLRCVPGGTMRRGCAPLQLAMHSRAWRQRAKEPCIPKPPEPPSTYRKVPEASAHLLAHLVALDAQLGHQGVARPKHLKPRHRPSHAWFLNQKKPACPCFDGSGCPTTGMSSS